MRLLAHFDPIPKWYVALLMATTGLVIAAVTSLAVYAVKARKRLPSREQRMVTLTLLVLAGAFLVALVVVRQIG
ncbi:MAG: hypothetical protein QOJ29_1844 [Thermoleophilaceae bacterium]|jgi:threonine/homoserine/homoserine lactone efflux protein|nr:hypothetical protein [Thermoleophilaceae bacterium]